jgi:uncharacterized protein (DUF2236 family)
MTRPVPLPSPSDWTAEEDRLGFFGPDSVTWRIHADPSYSVGGIRALLLQALHPVAMDGVARNSDGFRDEPWQRLIRTGQYVETLTFGTRTDARRMAARVRGLHGRLSGVEETTGRAYRVDDPDLLLWVHACEVESLLSTALRSGVPLTPEDADRYVAEQATAGLLVGVPSSLLPRSVADLDAYVAGIRPSLAITPAARDAARLILLPPMPGWVRFLTPAARAHPLVTHRAGGLRPGRAGGPAHGLSPAAGSGVVGEEAPGLAGRRRGLTGRAARPEVAPTALAARQRREGGVAVLAVDHR